MNSAAGPVRLAPPRFEVVRHGLARTTQRESLATQRQASLPVAPRRRVERALVHDERLVKLLEEPRQPAEHRRLERAAPPPQSRACCATCPVRMPQRMRV